MNITIIGTGLIGGSLAIAIRNLGIAEKIIGVEKNPQHAQKAVDLKLVDEVLPLKEAINQSKIIFIAIPVDIAGSMIESILEDVDDQVVIDLGSTKGVISEAADKSPKRGRFVAAHPMWGTEFSGPEAAVAGAFKGNAAVICDEGKSDPDAFETAEKIFESLGMNVVHMEAVAHDVHAAYVSHISHISSFALANTVLEKEKEEDAIFDMASGGFESTVRLAKSNASMWVPIFKQNRENVLDVLNEHISQLRKFKSCLEKENYTYLTELIENANKIKRILK
ncbi:MAG: prephenate dehydrogenase [Ginsengibacter sp.]